MPSNPSGGSVETDLIRQYRQFFDLIDTNGDQRITAAEVIRSLESLGIPPDPEVEATLYAGLPADGTLDFWEFLRIVGPRDHQPSTEPSIEETFQSFDRNGSGSLDREELRAFLRSVGKQFTDDQLTEMVQAADTDHDQRISFSEFERALLRKSSADHLDQVLRGPRALAEIIDSKGFVHSLREAALSHRAVRHPFLSRLADGMLPEPLAALRDFASEFRLYNSRHSDLLRMVARQLPNETNTEALEDCLREEAGQLSDGDLRTLRRIGMDPTWVQNIPHKKLFQRFCTAIAAPEAPVVGPGRDFVAALEGICRSGPEAAIGALAFGIEAVVPPIYRFIHRAIEDQTELTDEEAAFFPLHIEIDDAHADVLASIAAELATSWESRRAIESGMMAALEARAGLWDALLEQAESRAPTAAPEDNTPSRTIYDRAGTAWARDRPTCLSDFTAREPLFDALGDLTGLRVLDLGCGEGYCARRFAELGAREVVAMDLSQNQIDAALAEEARRPKGIHYHQGDAVDVAAELLRVDAHRDVDGKTGFDVIVAVFLFNYTTLADMQACLEQVHKLLRPGGRLLFTVPHPALPYWRVEQDTPFGFDLSRTGVRSGYFSGVDRLFPGRIETRDGRSLNVQLRHKTFADLLQVVKRAGFHEAPDVQELTVGPLLARDPWLAPLAGVPMHMLFALRSPEQGAAPIASSPIKDIIWSSALKPKHYTLQLPDTVLAELEAAHAAMCEQGITWENYRRGDIGPLPNSRYFALRLRRMLLEETGFALVQGLHMDPGSPEWEADCERAKTLYLLLSMEIGDVLERRGRLYEVRDRGLDVAKENVLFSSSREASGYHTDSTDRDYNPDIVGLLSLQKAHQGGELRVLNGLNIWLHLRQRLPAALMSELERPIIRDLVETGQGAASGSLWEQVRHSPQLSARRRRLRSNAFPIFTRNTQTGQFTMRYMRYWIESGHQRAGVPLSPTLRMALNALDHAMNDAPEIQRIKRTLEPGEMIWTNNHICAHDRTSFVSNPPGEAPRLKVRVWINFNPIWDQ